MLETKDLYVASCFLNGFGLCSTGTFKSRKQFKHTGYYEFVSPL